MKALHMTQGNPRQQPLDADTINICVLPAGFHRWCPAPPLTGFQSGLLTLSNLSQASSCHPWSSKAMQQQAKQLSQGLVMHLLLVRAHFVQQ
jgi:hypothetical protein